ncbi:MAG: adenylate/guanylate cyclase domain-containing protein [Burkholderiales bacterium]|nr:adenylate/guanylate cyclase domain-containing protein [Burkholderiales bacterium]
MRAPARFMQLFSAAFLLLALTEMGWLHSLLPLENRLSDLMVRQHASGLRPDPAIVLIEIDDASLARMEEIAGSWPWPRSVHGELLTGIANQQPQAVIFDLSFVERDVYRPESDRLFNQALQGLQYVYFPLIRQAELQDSAGPALAQIAPLLGIRPSPQAQAGAHVALLPPLALEPRYWRSGTINFLNDSDGVGRRYALYTDTYGWRIPSLPARVARELGYAVPEQADLLLAWRGKAGAFKRIAYADLYLDLDRKHPLRDRHELRDKIVIIGTNASALNDMRATPMDSLYPGAAILATALDNLKNQRYMLSLSPWIPACFGIVVLLTLYFQFTREYHALKLGSGLLTISGIGLGFSYLAQTQRILLPLLTPLLLAWLYYFACALQEYLDERRARQQAVQLFGRFVNPHVVQELIAGGGLSHAGESRDISVLFSDIRGFTTLSENRTPQQVVDLLNRYFSLQVAVIFKHGGCLDKFIGDCIMAFWGAPLDDNEHARHAIEAALEMSEVLQQFRQEIQQEDFDVGIGIHSGPAVVGLIGSEQRREYTAIGDTVNLASRIEGLTKGMARILVSRETRSSYQEAGGDQLDFQAVGSYKVKGREQEVELFVPTVVPSASSTGSPP